MKLSLFLLVAPILAITIDLQDYTQYFSLLEEFANTAQIPKNFVSFISRVQTYTDDSYSTLLNQDLLNDIETFVTGNPIFTMIPQYSALLEGIAAKTTGGADNESAAATKGDTTTGASGTNTTTRSTTSVGTSSAESTSASSTNSSTNGANVKLASLGGIVGVIGLLML